MPPGLITAAGSSAALATAAFDGATDARIAQLLGEDPPVRRPALSQVALSLLGLVVAVWLMMCLGQAALASVGRAADFPGCV